MEVTNTSIKLEGNAYLLRNISAVSVNSTDLVQASYAESESEYEERVTQLKEAKRKRIAFFAKLFFGSLCLDGAFIALGYSFEIGAHMKSSDLNMIIGSLMWLTGITFVLMLFSCFTKSDSDRREENLSLWKLIINTNSGKNSLLHSVDKDFLERLQNIILEAIDSLDTKQPLSYHVNIDKQEIINNDNSLNIVDASTTNNFDYSMSFSHYEGLNTDQLNYLTGSFSDAISELSQKLTDVGADKGQSELQELVEVIRENKAQDQKKVTKCWGALRGTLETYDLGETALKLASLIGTGVGMLAGV